ncbi:hypothetical protein TWF281_003334 [Arthrobotrys megalospora]
MGSSWRPPSDPPASASQPDFGPCGRYGPHIFRRFDIRNIQTPPQSREPSRESSLPSPICTTSRVAGSYRPGDSLFRSTPPTSPSYPSHWSPRDRKRKSTTPLPFGSEDGEVQGNGDDSDAATIIEPQNTPPKSPVKFDVPKQVISSPVKNQNILRKNQKEPEKSSEKDKNPAINKGDTEKTLEHAQTEPMPPNIKPNRPIPTGPAADRKPTSSSANVSTKEYLRWKERKKPVKNGLQKSPTPIDPDSCGTYPNNVIVVRPRFIRPKDEAKTPGQKRLPSRYADDIDMNDAPPSDDADISELLKDKPVVLKRVRDSGCQGGSSYHSPSYFVEEKTAEHGGRWDEDAEMQDVRDSGTSTCMVSITTPKPKPKRLPSEATSTLSALGDLDLEILVSRIVGELKDTLVNVKTEKLETPVKEERHKKSTVEPKTEKSRTDSRTMPGYRETKTPSRATGRQSTDGTPRNTTKRRLERRPSKSRTESSDEEAEDEEAFQRGRKQVSNPAAAPKPQTRKRSPSPGYEGQYEQEEDSPKPKTLADLHFRKRKRVETPVTEGQRRARSPSAAFSTVGSPCPFDRRASRINRETPLKFKGQISTAGAAPTPGAKLVKISESPYTPARSRAAMKAAASQRDRPKLLPETFWFQRYFNHLSSKTVRPNILSKTPKYFNRKMLSHYLGGNARLTVSPISPSAMFSQIHRTKCVVAIKKEFVPKSTGIGEVIVVSSPHNFAKQLPPGVSSFPVFLERNVSQWEYMGTYEFDTSKLFSNKEAAHLQDKHLIDFWIPRIFEMRHRPEGSRGYGRSAKLSRNNITLGRNKKQSSTGVTTTGPALSDTAVRSLATQLVPDHVRSRSHLRMLTIEQVEKFFQDGTLKLNWNFLKPVGYDNKLFEKLCKAKWPVEKDRSGVWSSLQM